jgi:N-hydroxyarylamine O-acetyltransferase
VWDLLQGREPSRGRDARWTGSTDLLADLRLGNLVRNNMDAAIDLDAYCARIGYDGPREPSLAVLRELNARHPAQIPFETLDPLLGRPVALDLASVQAKLVQGGRGGYCQEHNLLFHDVLAAMGFAVTPLGARVVWMTPGRDAPLTHRLTLVALDEGGFIADVGFGGQGPTAPLRLEPDLKQSTPHGFYRLRRDGDVYEAQFRLAGQWAPMYRFALTRQSRADFEVANWFTSTHPEALFVRNLLVARVVGQTRVNLRNADLSIRQADGKAEHRKLMGAQELATVLQEIMGLRLPVPAETIWRKLPADPDPLL